MSGTPTVSVVIPTYNRAEWLPASVGSVLAQTVQPLEILIVDDGSTDNTQEVCAAFPAPVRYIRQTNAGVSAARNRGIQEAEGDYVALLDSDDLWEPEKLEVQLEIHRIRPDVAWSATGVKVVGPDGLPTGGKQGFERVFAVFDGAGEPAERLFGRWLTELDLHAAGREWQAWCGDLFPPLFLGNFIIPSSALILRRLIGQVGGFEESFRLAEETEFFHRVAAAAPGAVISAPLTSYRVGLGESLISPQNMVGLIRNALLSGERAAALRAPLPPEAEAARAAGRRRLLTELAYVELSRRETGAARAAVCEAWRAGARGARLVAVYAAALFPRPVLGVLHSLKRKFK